MKVSVITPCSRPDDLPNLHRVFDSQDYEDKELIVINGEGSIGAKRNKACNIATGEIILMMDSDDWYAPDFITRSVTHLIQSGAAITGLNKAYFFGQGNMWLYEAKFKQPYVIGSGMTYYKSVWEKGHFPDKNSGEDLDFQANKGIIRPMDYLDGFMAMIHGNNTASHKQLSHMKRVNPEIAESILGESYGLYK